MSEPEGEPYKKPFPCVEIELGSIAVRLTYRNCTLYTYESTTDAFDYSFMNHAYFRPDETDDPIFIFDSPELIEQLDGLKFPNFRLPYPTPRDIETYVDYQSNNGDLPTNEA